jgi:hypothetical protein
MTNRRYIAAFLIGCVALTTLWHVFWFAIPLELGGQLVGVLFMFYGCLLAARPHLLDDYEYPWYIPTAAAAAGLGVSLTVTQYAIVGVLSSVWFTRFGYIALFLGGSLAFYAYWAHPPLPPRHSANS